MTPKTGKRIRYPHPTAHLVSYGVQYWSVVKRLRRGDRQNTAPIFPWHLLPLCFGKRQRRLSIYPLPLTLLLLLFPSLLAVVDPTQGALPPLLLEFDDGDAAPSSVAGDRATTIAIPLGNGRETGEQKQQAPTAAAAATTKDMAARAVEAAVVWEEMRTPEGAEAALTATGRLLAGNQLSIEALHLRGVALHLLGR